jgi:hypothetical protein
MSVFNLPLLSLTCIQFFQPHSDSGALRFIQMPPVQVERNDKRDSILAGVVADFRLNTKLFASEISIPFCPATKNFNIDLSYEKTKKQPRRERAITAAVETESFPESTA